MGMVCFNTSPAGPNEIRVHELICFLIKSDSCILKIHINFVNTKKEHPNYYKKYMQKQLLMGDKHSSGLLMLDYQGYMHTQHTFTEISDMWHASKELRKKIFAQAGSN